MGQGVLEAPAAGSRLRSKNAGDCLPRETVLKSGLAEVWSLASLFKLLNGLIKIECKAKLDAHLNSELPGNTYLMSSGFHSWHS